MLRIAILLSLFIVFTQPILSQIGYSPLIDSLISEVTIESVSELNKQLTGYEQTTIGGNPYTITTRRWYTMDNEMASQWIYEKLEDYGYSPAYQSFDLNADNVIAELTGSEFPDEYYIICAHYDDMPANGIAPGADDNASGVIAVLEAARLLSNYDSKYTIKFILFDKEEAGLYGSYYYASEAAANGDVILGVLNFDMIGWDSDSNYKYNISTDPYSTSLKNEYAIVSEYYQPDMPFMEVYNTASDHYPFWINGYKAIMLIEDQQDFNPHYHTVNDNFSNLNLEYFHKMVRVGVASIATLAWDYKIIIDHEPLISGYYLSDRIATAVVTSSHLIADGDKEPRLYYKVNEGDFETVLPFYHNADTFQFLIPAQSLGTQVEYYIAAQDEGSNFITTYPSGGRGIDPPGVIPPDDLFYYEISEIYNFTVCSQNTPVPVYDKNWIYDTILVETNGYLADLNVNIDITHTRAGDLSFWIISPDGETLLLSHQNGANGQNYTNTTFDDEASLSITEATPPFTGSYKPQALALTNFDNAEIAGPWVLRMFDFNNNNEGTLNSWCLSIAYEEETTDVLNAKLDIAKLEQNFPNPAKQFTNIRYSIPQPSNISLSIYDFYGRLIKILDKGLKQKGDHNIKINVDEFRAGTYYYVLTTEKGYLTKPLMVIK